FIDTVWYEVILITVTATLGMVGVAAGLSGYLVTDMNILERALALAEEDRVGASDLRLPQHAPRFGAGNAPATQEEAVVDLPAGNGALPSYIEQMERTAIQKALEENRWNKTRTAAQLGITFRALRYKLKKLGMD
ncbi:MAG: helix-turn-helix domain-containing protein, partial [Stenotrophomonas maltophilia]